MSTELPYPFFTEFDPSGPYRNPGQTLPRPSAQNLPAGCWIGGRSGLTWTAVDPVATGATFRATWSSPIFDLRPDLGVMSQNQANRSPSAVPIWRAAGMNVGVKLWVQISNLSGVNESVRVETTEEGHVCDVAQIQTILYPQEITAEFTSRNQNSILGFTPYGDGYPIRYWRLNLTFDILANFGVITPFPMVVQGALY